MKAIPARLDIETTLGGDEPAQATSNGNSALGAPEAGEAAEAAWTGHRHVVNIRLSIPLLFGRYYLTIVAGRERRSPKRLVSERYKHPLSTFGNLTFLFALGTIGGLAMLALMQFLSALLLQEMGMVVVPS